MIAMLRMSKLTDYGTVILACLARADGKTLTASDVATATTIAQPTVSKVLKALSRGGLLESYRGVSGGYALARAADEITAADIIDALEGPIAITECAQHESHCKLQSVCGVGDQWQRINRIIHEALRNVRLSELADPAVVTFPALNKALGLRPGVSGR
jgi:FeS assembly SUF system regulator